MPDPGSVDRADYTRRDGVLVPRTARVSFFLLPDYDLTVDVTAHREGTAAPVARQVDVWSQSRSITTADLRRVPVADLAARAIAACALRPEPHPARPDSAPVLIERGRSWWAWPAEDQQRARGLAKAGRPRRPRDHDLVARVYRENPKAPTEAVAAVLGVGRRRAVDYVREARAAGHDLPAPRRPKGES
jgi:hypothetical protein